MPISLTPLRKIGTEYSGDSEKGKKIPFRIKLIYSENSVISVVENSLVKRRI